jgi:DNA-binding NtrC family response regulator
LSKENHSDQHWFALTSEIQKLKEQWKETSKTHLPMLIAGESGVGKSYWIERSIEIRRQEVQAKVRRIDYSVKAEYFDIATKLPKNDQITILWWENFPLAPETEIQKWIQWWKDQKYSKTKSFILYWEINLEDIRILESDKHLKSLYDSLKIFQFTLGSLEKRNLDLKIFISHFIAKANDDLKKKILSLDDQFHHYFSKRKFKHNLHELRDVIYALVAFTPKKHVKFHQLPIHFFENSEDKLQIITGISLAVYEKAIIQENLKYVAGNRLKAAKLLGISERNLYRKISEYQLEDET